jgi:hypothetical protein
VDYIKFRNASAVGVVVIAVLILLLFQGTYLPVVSGLTILWGELMLGLAANRVSHKLTKEASLTLPPEFAHEFSA